MGCCRGLARGEPLLRGDHPVAPAVVRAPAAWATTPDKYAQTFVAYRTA